jgi:hypothetical protein
MTVSGTAVWNPDITEIIEEAYERAGLEVRTGYQFRTARRSLNILMQEWANKGINFWTIDQQVLALLPGQAQYTLPADTVDIIEHVIRQNTGVVASQTDLQISRIPLPTYATIPNKLSSGRPVQIYVDRQRDAPSISVWPVPSDSTYSLVYWRMRRLDDAGSPGTNTMDVPFRFTPALIAGLAYYVALKDPAGADRVDMLKKLYDETFFQATIEDRDRSSVSFVPRRSYI